MSDDGPANAGDTPAPPANAAPAPPANAGDPPAATARRKKRRRRAARDGAPPPEQESRPEEAADAADERVPAFARSWPHDPALDALVTAFEAGEYARVRREAPDLARRTEDDAVRRAARELRRRLDPDPVAVYMLMAAAALLVFLAGWYWLHPHAP